MADGLELKYTFEADMHRFLGLNTVARERIEKGLTEVALLVEGRAKDNARDRLNTTGLATGQLVNSIATTVDKGQLKAEIGPHVIYGRIHELGGEITPVNGQFLHFVVGGQSVFARHVTIPARPYLSTALEASRADIGDLFLDPLREALS